MLNRLDKFHKNRMQKRYFTAKDKKEMDLYFLIDCYEKILYNALHEYVEDCKIAFCNDINLKLCIDTFGFYPNDLGLKDELFCVRKYMPKAQEASNFLEKLIDSEKIVAVCTMFDMLPSHAWYQQKDKEGTSNTHFCTIICYDEDYYYWVDDPSMLAHDVKMWPDNPTVGMLEKKYFKEAFEQYCEIITVEVKKDRIANIDNFIFIIKKIVENYYKVEMEELDGKSLFTGRRALLEFAELINKNEVLDSVASNYYWIYLMSERRVLFKQCLEKKQVMFENINRVCELLDLSCEEWKKLYFRISAYYYGSGSADKTKLCLIERIHKIIELEDCLMEELEALTLEIKVF